MIRLRPEDPASPRCDVAGCPREYEIRYVAGADEHRARERDVKLCAPDLARYQAELDVLRNHSAAT